MKSWLKEKLKKFLGIDNLEKNMEKQQINMNHRYNGLEKDYSQLKSLNSQIIKDNDSIMKQFDISLDVTGLRGRNESWAVICIQGKPEYVRFVDMSNYDMREVSLFLKRFERTNRTIDSPIAFFKWE